MREWRRDAAPPAGETLRLRPGQVPALQSPALSVPPLRGPVSPPVRLSQVQQPDIPVPPITIERKIVDETVHAADPPPQRASNTSQSITRIVTRDRVAPPRVIERLRVRREDSMAAQAAQAPVEITIGRIDIRAVVAAQPPAPKAKPQPRILSLDEYAAKRDGRSR